ncbi:MAG: 50S ribosomal protein L9 [Flavobacteriaceae bacterium]|nr:50S ribosomal protein L9 [Flavobacteriaceae bacterium]
MELILIKDVENLGFSDDLVTVKNGYGRNFLIPQGFAKLATLSAKKVLTENLKQRAFKEQKTIEDANRKAKAITALEIKIKAKVGTGTKLFGSINNTDVSKAIDTAGFEIDKKFISLPGSLIKRTGKYNAKIRLHRNVIFDFPFEVIEDESQKKKTKAKPAPKKVVAVSKEEE